MRIKQLKLSGFKSFANKTVINFDENFIGVVGPNGSGKSNVIDAIRWVFGEKSNKSLRGNSSTDIIFGGTEKRKKQNIAEVTIVLDNSDHHLEVEWDEVAFTRRLYRSGKSEYLINGVEARYKDIQELILDKGIGKNAFSIISQGKIEEIIVTSPENRRLIVEEVAGILKYKKRKESALNKLGKTDDNLEQVNLILNEIDERRGPLERQAATAEKYNAYKSDLDVKEVDLLVTRIKQNEEEVSGLKEIVDTSQTELMQLETEENKLDVEETVLSEKLNELSINANSLTQQLNLKLSELSKQRTNLQVLKERQALTQNYDKRMAELEQTKLRLKAELHSAKQQLASIEGQLNSSRSKFDAANSSASGKRKQINDLTFKINDVKNELNKVTSPFATRKVIEANIGGIIATVSDSFNVDIKYTEAISTIIGGRMHDVITTDRQSAVKGIEYLKSNRFGRQTFLPQREMKPMYVDNTVISSLESVNGFIGIGVDLIRFDEDNRKIFANLLGNVIVCENLKVAQYVSREVTNRYRIVTLEGDLIQSSGAMSGGRSKRQNKLVLEANLSKLKNERDKLQLIISNSGEKVANEQDKLIEIETKYRMEQSHVSTLENELRVIEVELKENDAPVDDNESNELELLINKLELDVEKINGEKSLNDIEMQGLKDNQEQLKLELRSIRDEIKTISASFASQSVKVERLTIALKSDLSVLREDYQMSFNMALDKANTNIDIDQYQLEVKSLKSKIRNLGPINLLAIDEYRELTERHTFIDEQRNDLIVAKEKLESIIHKLDEFFVTSFESTYVKLRREFQLVYKELFGGGHADLILTNEDDLLYSGVEIVAQPPGKKLQTISLLSGGEKALTAIALLFAILRIRSLPFAILDEVEAALDEANVKRYAQYIKVFSERTQFIVITHRQGTMETVDSLYGVTMQEKGVSTTVKVKLNEGEDYEQFIQ